VFLILAVAALPAQAVDLTEIDRKIAAEPDYQSRPKYCLLVFGREARTRVWLVADGDTLHVSHNDGDLRGTGSRVVKMQVSPTSAFANIGDVVEVDGTKHTNLRVTRYSDCWTVRVVIAGGDRAAVRLQSAGYDPVEARWRNGTGYDEHDKLNFADRPQDAPIIHFNGPRTIGISGPAPTLDREGKAVLKLGFGTPGLGTGTFAAFQGCAVLGHGMVANIEFPSGKSPGETIKTSTTITNHH
jgi:hypothetical protein